LQRLLDLFGAETVVAHEGGQQRIEAGEGLGAGGLALERVEKVDDLAERGAEVLGREALGLAGDAFEAAAQEVLQVPAHAVDTEQAQIVQMHRAVVVRLADF